MYFTPDFLKFWKQHYVIVDASEYSYSARVQEHIDRANRQLAIEQVAMAKMKLIIEQSQRSQEFLIRNHAKA